MNNEDQPEPHAVRWATRTVRKELAYTLWHWTVDANVTVCGLIIRLGNKGGTFLPETDAGRTRDEVTCRKCKKKDERVAREAEEKRQAEIATLNTEISKRQKRLAELRVS